MDAENSSHKLPKQNEANVDQLSISGMLLIFEIKISLILIQGLKLPPVVKMRGRPKGHSKTTIGLPSKKNHSRKPQAFIGLHTSIKEKGLQCDLCATNPNIYEHYYTILFMPQFAHAQAWYMHVYGTASVCLFIVISVCLFVSRSIIIILFSEYVSVVYTKEELWRFT